MGRRQTADDDKDVSAECDKGACMGYNCNDSQMNRRQREESKEAKLITYRA